eukprot:TRINITY_DN392_c0_g1_i14.p2 TRINITY_DN392_c0_g1~~TRINITY_DN392_c0_g1_i14.p2  ORF type:complete len:218 (+),score=50.21 TRINITY_DN392_c0_g1_i14:857-1510(+)
MPPLVSIDPKHRFHPPGGWTLEVDGVSLDEAIRGVCGLVALLPGVDVPSVGRLPLIGGLRWTAKVAFPAGGGGPRLEQFGPGPFQIKALPGGKAFALAVGRAVERAEDVCEQALAGVALDAATVEAFKAELPEPLQKVVECLTGTLRTLFVEVAAGAGLRALSWKCGLGEGTIGVTKTRDGGWTLEVEGVSLDDRIVGMSGLEALLHHPHITLVHSP